MKLGAAFFAPFFVWLLGQKWWHHCQNRAGPDDVRIELRIAEGFIDVNLPILADEPANPLAAIAAPNDATLAPGDIGNALCVDPEKHQMIFHGAEHA